MNGLLSFQQSHYLMQADYGVIGINVDKRKGRERERERERERVSLEGVALSTASISVSSPQHLSILVREMTGTEDAAPHEGTQAGRGILANFDSVISKRLRPLFFLSPLGCHNAQGSFREREDSFSSALLPAPRARPKLTC